MLVCVRECVYVCEKLNGALSRTHTHYGFCVTHSTEKPSNPHWKLCLWCRSSSSNTYVCTFGQICCFVTLSLSATLNLSCIHAKTMEASTSCICACWCVCMSARPCVCMCDLLAKTFYFSVFCLTFKLIAFKWLGATVKRLLANERFTMFDSDDNDSSHDTTQPPPTPHSRPHFKLLTHRNGWLTNASYHI